VDRKIGGRKMLGAIIAGFLLGYILGAVFSTGKEADDE
jgi:hypothetical protein